MHGVHVDRVRFPAARQDVLEKDRPLVFCQRPSEHARDIFLLLLVLLGRRTIAGRRRRSGGLVGLRGLAGFNPLGLGLDRLVLLGDRVVPRLDRFLLLLDRGDEQSG